MVKPSNKEQPEGSKYITAFCNTKCSYNNIQNLYVSSGIKVSRMTSWGLSHLGTLGGVPLLLLKLASRRRQGWKQIATVL